MAKRKRMKVICPCCKAQIENRGLEQVSTLFPFDGFMSLGNQNYLKSFLEVVGRGYNHYQWACDICIKSKKAILANPQKQHYTFNHPMDTANPYLAYYDKEFTCETCKHTAVFSKEEQKYWYETLSFVVYSKPTSCKKCRQEMRRIKNLNTELSELLIDGEPKEKVNYYGYQKSTGKWVKRKK